MVNCEGESHFLIAMDIKGVYPVRAYFHNLKAARHVALAMAALTICAVTAALLKTAPAPRHPPLASSGRTALHADRWLSQRRRPPPGPLPLVSPAHPAKPWSASNWRLPR